MTEVPVETFTDAKHKHFISMSDFYHSNTTVLITAEKTVKNRKNEAQKKGKWEDTPEPIRLLIGAGQI